MSRPATFCTRLPDVVFKKIGETAFTDTLTDSFKGLFKCPGCNICSNPYVLYFTFILEPTKMWKNMGEIFPLQLRSLKFPKEAFRNTISFKPGASGGCFQKKIQQWTG